MKYFLTFMFFIVCGKTISQNIQLLKTEKFTGVIFPANYDLSGIFGTQNRFTPTELEIAELEMILKAQIAELNKNRFSQKNKYNRKNRCPTIDKNLKKYVRQYAGFYNEKGERIIYINCIWHKYTEIGDDNIERQVWKTNWLTISDGGSYYWNVQYNLDTKTFFNFSVNGIA